MSRGPSTLQCLGNVGIRAPPSSGVPAGWCTPSRPPQTMGQGIWDQDAHIPAQAKQLGTAHRGWEGPWPGLGGFLEASLKQIPGLGFWTAPLPCSLPPRLSRRAGAFKSFFSPPS